MSSAAPSPLSFSRETFAKLSPSPFLLAHLKPTSKTTPPTRPSGRSPLDFRTPSINTGSLAHSNGSAVVRIGATAVVCGVRAEILRAQDIPRPYRETISTAADPASASAAGSQGDSASREIEELGLLVPNLELSTGCSPAHLPGNAPGTQAQSLSQRLLGTLITADLVRVQDLRVRYTEPKTEEDEDEDDEEREVTKAYWVLYLDVLVMSLDGNAFDAAWAAVVAALRDTKIPGAYWDPDSERVVASPLVGESRRLQLRGLPIASSFVVFSTADQLKDRSEAENWVLADPDGFEEELCRESVTVVVTPQREDGSGGVIKIEKNGGGVVDVKKMKELVALAMDRWSDWEGLLREAEG
ncbi:hypothetical protein MBLNU457_g0354t1 [Dothideomycetes sp. NU457]